MKSWEISVKDMCNSIMKYKIMLLLSLFVLSQIIMLLILNFIPLGGDCEWASVCREWIEKIIGLS